MAAVKATSHFYHRKLDRSAEKEDFYKLPESDKQLISHLRSVVDTARCNVTKLRDDMDDKERDLSKETALRKAAEARLEHLVDMYGDPAVNEELKSRLPRANKDSDPRRDAEEQLRQLDAHRRHADEENRTRSRSADAGRRGRHRARSEWEGESEGEGGRSRSHSPPGSRRYQYPYMYPPYPMYPPQYMMPGLMHPAMASGMLAPGQYGAYPATTGGPTAGGLTAGGLTPGGLTAGGPAAGGFADTGSHLYNIPQPYTTSSSYFPANHIIPNMTTAFSTNQITPTMTTAFSANHVAPITTAAQISSQSETVFQDAKAASINREQNIQISLLTTELDQQKNLNKKLMEKVSMLEREVDSTRVNSQSTEAATAAMDSIGKIADLVEKIYRAQEKRDEAVMGRLRLANEERDEALMRIKEHDAQPNSVQLNDTDKTVGELLGKIDSSTTATQYTQLLADAIRLRNKRHHEVTNEEMTAILQDRDAYFNKCKHLEYEVLKLQRINRVRTSDKQDQSLLQAKLLTTQHERDVAVMKLQKLEDEMQTLQLYYGLHRSLSPGGNLQDDVEDAVKLMKNPFQKPGMTQPGMTQPGMTQPGMQDGWTKLPDNLETKLQKAQTERDRMIAELAQARTETRNAQEHAKRLERLVNVLRRKINGLGSKMQD